MVDPHVPAEAKVRRHRRKDHAVHDDGLLRGEVWILSSSPSISWKPIGMQGQWQAGKFVRLILSVDTCEEWCFFLEGLT